MTHTYQKTQHRSSLEILQEEAGAKNWWLSLPLAFLAIAAGSLISGGLSQWLLLPSMTDANRLLLGMISLSVFLGSSLVLILFVAKFWERRSLASFGLWKEKLGFNLLLGTALGFLLVLLEVGFNLLGGQLHIQVEKQFNLGIWLFFLVNFFFQALAEEMIYRGFVMNKLRTKLSLLPAVLLNSLLFAVIHIFKGGTSVLYILNVFLTGIFLSLLFALTDNLWLVTALHAAHNMIYLGVFGVIGAGNNLQHGSFLQTTLTSQANSFLAGTPSEPLSGGLIAVIVMALAALLTAYLAKKKQVFS